MPKKTNSTKVPGMPYQPRSIDQALLDLLPEAPAIAIEGAKGVGKTETALQQANHQLFLDNPADRIVAEADPMLEQLPDGTILIDEWQNAPSTWDAVRRAVDRGAAPGRFILTGSATPAAGIDSHSGAGGILSLHMRPMALFERGGRTPTVSLAAMFDGDADISGTSAAALPDYVEAIGSSGFPGIHRLSPQLRQRHLTSYIDRVIDRDLPGAGYATRKPDTLRRWMAAYGAASSTTTTYSGILDATTAGDGSQPAKDTTAQFRDLLTSIWILDPVPAWNSLRNPLKTVRLSPKHQLVDPALALILQRLGPRDLTSQRGNHLLGPLFESLATLSVRAAATATGASVSHLRTAKGLHEVDLIAESFDGRLIGFEVKLSVSVTDTDVRHLLWLREQFPEDVVDLAVLYSGPAAYRRADGVACIPLDLLGS